MLPSKTFMEEALDQEKTVALRWGSSLRSSYFSFLGLAEIELEVLKNPPCLDPGSSINMTHGL